MTTVNAEMDQFNPMNATWLCNSTVRAVSHGHDMVHIAMKILFLRTKLLFSRTKYTRFKGNKSRYVHMAYIYSMHAQLLVFFYDTAFLAV